MHTHTVKWLAAEAHKRPEEMGVNEALHTTEHNTLLHCHYHLPLCNNADMHCTAIVGRKSYGIQRKEVILFI